MNESRKGDKFKEMFDLRCLNIEGEIRVSIGRRGKTNKKSSKKKEGKL